MKRILVDLLRRAVGTAGVPDRLGAMQAEIGPARHATKPCPARPIRAMPLEYPPSRDLRPRWGNTRPAIAPLAEWMGRQDADYHATLAAMRARAPQLARIRHDFDPDLLPEPAWCG